jgi:hypothetical protein
LFGLPFEFNDDLRDCRILWNFFMEAIRAYTGDKHGCLFNAAVGGPELAVRLNPLRVLPHANYIAWSPGFSIDHARQLRRYVRQKMRDCRPLQTKLFPCIACYRIRSSDDLRRIANYIFKPIDIATAYKNGVTSTNQTPQELSALNSQVKLFLKSVVDVFSNFSRIRRYGRCNANHSQYFGQISPRRLAQRQRMASRKTFEHNERKRSRKSKMHDVERWELHQLDQLNHPSLMGKPKFYYWLANNERVPPRPPHLGRPPTK